MQRSHALHLTQPQQSVLDLLALIHRDGGHYTSDHGIEKSIQDAFDKIAELRTQQAVTDGWRWVPVELTMEMMEKAERVIIATDQGTDTSLMGSEAKEVWKAMLSAAPAYNGKKEG